MRVPKAGLLAIVTTCWLSRPAGVAQKFFSLNGFSNINRWFAVR